ncbi:cytochrome c oxidase subunit II [Variovorax sp. W2I14]
MKSIWRNKYRPANLLLAAGAAFSSAAHAVNDLPGGPSVRQLNLPVGVTKIAQEQHLLHTIMMILCTVIFVAVFAVMFYSIWKHRKSVGHKAANFHESVVVEVIWTIVPFLIVIVMALPATKVLVAQKDTTNADLTIKTTGYQWKWGYDYLNGEGEGLAFISTLDSSQRAMSDAGAKGAMPDDYLLKVDNPLVVPVNKKVRIITTANDVIHAFAVPQLGVKQDAIPGFVRDTWFRAEAVGDYYGQCQELCGKEHAYMPIHVKVVSSADYTTWVAAKRKEAAAKLDDPDQGLGAARDAGARREGLRRQLRSLPPGQRQGRGPDQAAGRLRQGGCRRSQGAAGSAAQRPEQRCDAFLETAERHRPRGRGHLHQEQLVEQDGPAGAAGRSAGPARQVTRQQQRPAKKKLQGTTK